MYWHRQVAGINSEYGTCDMKWNERIVHYWKNSINSQQLHDIRTLHVWSLLHDTWTSLSVSIAAPLKTDDPLQSSADLNNTLNQMCLLHNVLLKQAKLLQQNEWGSNSNWVSLTSHQTHYRSSQGWVSTGQVTQPTVSKHWRKTGC